MNSDSSKKCNCCLAIKEMAAFRKTKSGKGGRDSVCKACLSAKKKTEYAKNPEMYIKRASAWAKNNTERRREIEEKWYSNNKEKAVKRSNKWREENPERARLIALKGRLMRDYGLSVEQYNELLKDHDESCAICSRRVPLCIDHDHKTGEVRGLLCGNCNSGIGMLGDDPRLLEKAIVYLSKQSHPYYDIDKDYENLGPASVCN